MTAPTKVITCTLRTLPEHLHAAAAKVATEENPVNRPHGPGPIERIAALTSKYWGPKGAADLSVSFMETTPAELKDRVLSHMNAWCDVAGAGVRFRATNGSGVVRITREGDGYWSYLGTDVKMVGAGEPTMCLEGFTMQTSEAEYKRVVRHETGHTLGFPHEHMRKDIVALLDREKTIAYFKKTYNWDRQTVIEQVLTPVEESSLLEPTRADGTSIMCYQLPGACTRSGKPIPGGLDLDDLDQQYAVRIYPAAEVPPAPPPAPGLPAYVALFDAAGREIARYHQ